MTARYFFKKLTLPYKILYHREQTTIDRQRLTLLLFCYLPVLVIGILANFLNLTEPSAPFFNYTHSACLVAAIIFFVLYCKKKISIGACLSACTIIGQTVISVEMIYCALHPLPYYNMLIVANMVLLALNMMVAMAASLRINTLVLGIANVAIYTVSSLLSHSTVMQSFIVVFALAFVFSSFIGVWMAKSVSKIENENDEMKKDELKFLNIMRLKRNDVKAFMDLATKKHSDDNTQMLIDRLDDRSKRNLLTNVDQYMKNRDSEMENISKIFPEFTPSELDICQLILQGKKLNEISILLFKSVSNVSSQRANMRKKLGLKTSDNLLKALQQRIEDAK